MGAAAGQVVPAIAGVLASGGSFIQGEQARKAQTRSLRRQDKVQADAQAASISQRRENAQSVRKANQKKPDIGSILASAQQFGLAGLASTQLTGPLGTPLGG